MFQGRFEWTIGVVGVAVVGMIVGWYSAVWTRHVDRVSLRAQPAAEQPAAKQPAATPRPAVEPSPPPVIDPAPALAPSAALPQRPVRSAQRTARFTLVAARGDTWLQVRSGSYSGRVLYDGVLAQGELIRLRSPRLWVRFGSGSNIDLRINGYRAELPLFGTYDALLTPRGARPDPIDHAAVGQATAAQSP